MKKHCCNTYAIKSLLGIINDTNTPKLCPDYCVIVPEAGNLPRPEKCPDLLAFVNESGIRYGGFFYDINLSVWLPIFELTSVIFTDTGEVKGIQGILQPQYELIINGKAYSPDQVLNGINFPVPLDAPIGLIYRNVKTGCQLKGQTITN
jgi:hypothetical protein